MRTVRRPSNGIVGVGYQGSAVESFVDGLVGEGVARVVDVRLTPVSRKAGFSKTRLAQTLSQAGIDYEHRPELGNPKANRAGFGGTPEQLAASRAVFAALLAGPEATEAIEQLAAAALTERVALLCFEAEQHRCHRDVLLTEIARRFSAASGSRRRAR